MKALFIVGDFRSGSTLLQHLRALKDGWSPWASFDGWSRWGTQVKCVRSPGREGSILETGDFVGRSFIKESH